MRTAANLACFLLCIFSTTIRGQKLYGVSMLSGNGWLSEIDPNSGSNIVLSASSYSPGGVYQAICTINPDSGTFHFLKSDSLLTVDLISGTILSRVKVSGNFTAIEYNCKDGLLYTLEISTSVISLATLDPTSGIKNTINTFPSYSGLIQGEYGINPQNNSMYFLSTGDTLNTINLNTGLLVSKQKLTGGQGFLFTGMLEYFNHYYYGVSV